jgi:hypothetical protein
MSVDKGKYDISAQFENFTRYSDFNSKLGSSDCFNFLDENPASLNDGYFEYAANPFALAIGDRQPPTMGLPLLFLLRRSCRAS